MSPDIIVLARAFVLALIFAAAGCAVLWLIERWRKRKREEAVRESTEREFRNTLMAEAAEEFGPHPYGATSISEHMRATEARERQVLSYEGGGKVSVPVSDIVRSLKVQEQVKAARELERATEAREKLTAYRRRLKR